MHLSERCVCVCVRECVCVSVFVPSILAPVYSPNLSLDHRGDRQRCVLFKLSVGMVFILRG